MSAAPKMAGEFVWRWLLVRESLSEPAGVAESDGDGVSTKDKGLTWYIDWAVCRGEVVDGGLGLIGVLLDLLAAVEAPVLVEVTGVAVGVGVGVLVVGLTAPGVGTAGCQLPS